MFAWRVVYSLCAGVAAGSSAFFRSRRANIEFAFYFSAYRESLANIERGVSLMALGSFVFPLFIRSARYSRSCTVTRVLKRYLTTPIQH